MEPDPFSPPSQYPAGIRAGTLGVFVKSVLPAWLRAGLILLLACAQPALAQVALAQPALAQPATPQHGEPARPVDVAPVIVDGNALFPLRGSPSYPAQERAAVVRANIIAAARDPGVAATDVRAVDAGDRTQLYAGDRLLLEMFDLDGQFEGVDRKILALTFVRRTARAIEQYRHDRSRPVLLRNVAFALAAIALLVLALWAIVRLSRWGTGLAHRRMQRRLQSLEDKAHRLVRAEQVWAVLAGLLGIARLLLVVLLVYACLHAVLGLFPWTRPASLMLAGLVIDPLQKLWQGAVASIPDLVFLAVLFVVVRYIVRLARLFFKAVELGRIRLENFDPDWAAPTFRILRFLIIALAVVVAYPYIPGSDSMAFKGVTLFLGVIFSLGSSSFIANMIAGLSMTYRGAFKQGELVRIGEVVGVVDDIKLMTTRIRTAKNEIAVIPNSSILSTNVVNYSALAGGDGLVLHAVVGVGYDVPWRKVEAMLLEAVARTDGLKAEPKPFVLHQSLGDFTASYEVNAYCEEALRMLSMYSALNANIQDVFNEHGVEMRSPTYTQLLPPPGATPESAAAAPTLKPGPGPADPGFGQG